MIAFWTSLWWIYSFLVYQNQLLTKQEVLVVNAENYLRICHHLY
jgi:hypothetical protein